MNGKRRLRTVYAATILGVMAMVGGYVLAASTTTTGPAQGSNITSTTPSGFTTATVASSQLVVLTATTSGYAALGSQAAGTAGLSGTTTALSTCASGPCTGNGSPATQTNAATSGHYAEQLVIAVIQPLSGSGASGFDMSITVNFGASSVASANFYVSTGTTSAGTTQTVNVYVFVDLGTGTAQTVSSVAVVFNGCATAAACP
jgi:hypothetical protein